MNTCLDNLPKTLWWETDEEGRGTVYLIDQTKLPLREEIMSCYTHDEMIDAIKTLAVRGAPALGVSGAFALALWACNESSESTLEEFILALKRVGKKVSDARPTAVNLSWGVQQIVDKVSSLCAECAECAGNASRTDLSVDYVKQEICKLALSIYDDDIKTNISIGNNGADLLKVGSRVLTHCNAGSLATAFFGTALGVIYAAHDKGLIEHVYACETRPVNQGGRLTAWELTRAGVNTTLICDNMSASVMSKGLIDAVIVGADRIASNGDTANKIGTMSHAILAKHFGIPFYIAAPMSTIDMSIKTGKEIKIEERNPSEITGFSSSNIIDSAFISPKTRLALYELADGDEGRRIEMQGGSWIDIQRDAQNPDTYAIDAWVRNTPLDIDVFNPAFDVTPCNLISAIITEKGVFKPNADGEFCFT